MSFKAVGINNIKHRELFFIVERWERVGGLEALIMDIAEAFSGIGWTVKLYPLFHYDPLVVSPKVNIIRRPLRNRVLRYLWERWFWKWFTLLAVLRHTSLDTVILYGHVHLLPLDRYIKILRKGPRWVWTFGIDVWGERAKIWRPYLNRLDRIVAISKYTADRMNEEGVVVSISVVPCCTNISLFVPTTIPKKIRRNEIFICGRMSSKESYKGHEVLFHALPIAEKLLDKQLEIRVVGTGDEVVKLQGVAKTIGIADRVIFTGRIQQVELIEAYQHCGVFCMPSRVDRNLTGFWTGEGFGIVYIEAAACGRPVIASCEGGATETVVPGETGLLIDPRSPQAIAEAIAKILGSPDLADKMGMAGRALVEKRFSREAFVENIRQFVLEA